MKRKSVNNSILALLFIITSLGWIISPNHLIGDVTTITSASSLDGDVGAAYTNINTRHVRGSYSTAYIGYDYSSTYGNKDRRTFLGFPLSSIPSGAVVTKATMVVRITSVSGDPAGTFTNVWIDHLDYGTSLDEVDYDANAQDSNIHVFQPSSGSGEYSFDVTTYVSNDVANSKSYSGYRLRTKFYDPGGTSDILWRVRTREGSSPYCRLIVYYTPPLTPQDSLTFTKYDVIPAQPLVNELSNLSVYAFKLTEASNNGRLRHIKIAFTNDISIISNVELWYDNNANYQWDPSDTFITNLTGQISGTIAYYSNYDISKSIGAGGSGTNFIITVDLKSDIGNAEILRSAMFSNYIFVSNTTSGTTFYAPTGFTPNQYEFTKLYEPYEVTTNDANGQAVRDGDRVWLHGFVLDRNNRAKYKGTWLAGGDTSKIHNGVVLYFNSTDTNLASMGQELTIYGEIDWFKGVTELASIKKIITNNNNATLPAPIIISCAQITNNHDTNESMLVKITNAQVVSTQGSAYGVYWYLDDGSGHLGKVYIDNDTGINHQPPTNRIDITGVMYQYDTSTPYWDEYYVCLRTPDDIVTSGGGGAPGGEVLTYQKIDTPQKNVKPQTSEATNVPLLGFSLTDNTNGAVIRKIIVGSFGSNKIVNTNGNIRLWRDDGDNTFDSGDTLETNLTISSQAPTFYLYKASNLNISLTNDKTALFFVTIDITTNTSYSNGLPIYGFIPASGIQVTNSTTGSNFLVPESAVTNANPVVYYQNLPPKLTGLQVKAPVVFDTYAFKGRLNTTFTLEVTYSDEENDWPGILATNEGGFTPTRQSNTVAVVIYTNPAQPPYGFIFMENVTGSTDFINGVLFRKAFTGNFEVVSLDGTQTNTLYNLYQTYTTNLQYNIGVQGLSGTPGDTTIMAPGNKKVTFFPSADNKYKIWIDNEAPSVDASKVTVTDITTTTAKVNWNGVSSATDLASTPYMLEWGTTTSYGSSTGWISATDKTLTSLLPATKYYYRLTVRDDVGNTSSVTGSFTTKSGVMVGEVNVADINEAAAVPAVIDKGTTVYFTYAKEQTEIKIYNIMGDLVDTVKVENGNVGSWTPSSDVASGMYFAVYEDKDGNKKVVKFVYGVKK